MFAVVAMFAGVCVHKQQQYYVVIAVFRANVKGA
jgi:hypothetical protein